MEMPHPQILKLIDHVRAIKTNREISCIKKSARILDCALIKIKEIFSPGQTELEAAKQLEVILTKFGVTQAAFTPIVAFGKNTADIHHWPSMQRLQKKDIIMIDCGVVVNGFCSDMTRIFFIGTPTTKQEKIYNIVLRAQMSAIQKIKNNVLCKNLDDTVRNIFKKTKLNHYFTHNLGHGVGQYIHEWPRLGKKSRDVLQENMVVTVEPGIYIKGWGGIRIEDMVLVKQKGCEILTHTPKDIQSVILKCEFPISN